MRFEGRPPSVTTNRLLSGQCSPISGTRSNRNNYFALLLFEMHRLRLSCLELILKFMLFWALWPAPIRRGSIPDRGHGVKKRCWGRQGNMFWGNFVVFYRKNASPVPTPVQIEAVVSESVCFTNCFYLKRTRLHMDLGLLLFVKNIEYLLK